MFLPLEEKFLEDEGKEKKRLKQNKCKPLGQFLEKRFND